MGIIFSGQLSLVVLDAYQEFPVVNSIGVPQAINESRDIPDVPLDSRTGVLKLDCEA